MYDVVALGELLIDFTTQATDPDGYPTMAAHPGGAPANFLAAIAKFGGKAALLGKVGTDTFGKLLTNTLPRRGSRRKDLWRRRCVHNAGVRHAGQKRRPRICFRAQARRRHAAVV